MPEKIKILLVDDDPALLTVLEAGLGLDPSHEVTAVVDAQVAMNKLAQAEYDLVVADYSLGHPTINGLAILREAQERHAGCLVIIITAFASMQITLESIKLGAYDFLTKPFQIEELQLVVRNAGELVSLRKTNGLLLRQISELSAAIGQIGVHHAELIERMRQTAMNSEGGEPPQPGHGGATDYPAVLELRRRRMREQVSSYVRLGETISEQLLRERERIESLVEIGLIPEQTYQRALAEGRLRESDG